MLCCHFGWRVLQGTDFLLRLGAQLFVLITPQVTIGIHLSKGLSYMVMTIPYIAEEMAVATDKTRYKDVKVRIPEEELAVLNCRVAKTGMSREQYIRCLIADTIPAEYPPADYRLIIRKLDELQEVMEALVDENPVKRDAMKLYITLQNVASTADVLRRAVMPFVSRREKK